LNLYIDESGNFANSPNKESWNVVAAIAASESARQALSDAISHTRLAAGAAPNEEVKLNRLDEQAYLSFLAELDRPDIVLFATATDSGFNSLASVGRHKTLQVNNVRRAIPRMRHEGGRLGVQLLADQLDALSPQLYVQLMCQVNLLYDVIARSINYFAQRRPGTLREFRWRIDQKNTVKTIFEEAFLKIAPALLQTRSIEEPMVRVHGFNYGHMKAYEFEGGKMPDYLQTDFGLPEMEGFNIQKLIRGDIKFVDSKVIYGVQVIDLLARGLRRLLRGQFNDINGMAKAIGRLTMENRRGQHPISLINFSGAEEAASPHISRVVQTISTASKNMLCQRSS
jgi:hypothetical protein